MHDPISQPTPIVRVIRNAELRQLLAFAGHSIDDVVSCPVARRRVAFYHRVGRQIARTAEVAALERQWNPLGR